jgi:hypothetical protein
VPKQHHWRTIEFVTSQQSSVAQEAQGFQRACQKVICRITSNHEAFFSHTAGVLRRVEVERMRLMFLSIYHVFIAMMRQVALVLSFLVCGNTAAAQSCDLRCQSAACHGCLASTNVCYPEETQSDCFAHQWCWCGPETCAGSSSGLISSDCGAWRSIVHNSSYFVEADPPTCQDPKHLNDPCACTAINCEGGRIVGVDLFNRSLAFDASSDDSLSYLKGLQTLKLGFNQLQGALPPWLGSLSASLAHLDLSGNPLSGSIDTVKQLPKLTFLYLGGTKVSGGIDAVAELKSLTSLGLDHTAVSGPIAPVKELTKLTYLSFMDSLVSGSIGAVQSLTKLRTLDLSYSKLNGTIDAVAGLTALSNLNLHGGDFSGLVPSGPIDWTKPVLCDISGSNFRCPLPPGAAANCKATCA